MAAGPTTIDSVFKTLVDEEPSSERDKEKKAHLITIMSNYEICTKITEDNSAHLKQKLQNASAKLIFC